jgi:hypothetical protein
VVPTPWRTGGPITLANDKQDTRIPDRSPSTRGASCNACVRASTPPQHQVGTGHRAPGFFIASQTGSLHNVTADELADTIAHQDNVNTLIVDYSNFRSPGHRFELWVGNHRSEVVEGHCEITAPNTSDSNGHGNEFVHLLAERTIGKCRAAQGCKSLINPRDHSA